MIGTLRIQRQRLNADQRTAYRAVYCAGCHALHEFCGRTASLLTSYDQAVLGLVLAGLGRTASVEGRACTAWPFRTVPVQVLEPQARALLAALDVGAVEAKLRDDVDDGDRPLRNRIALRLLRRPSSRARGALLRLGFPVSLLERMPARQAAVERSPAPTMDELASPSAALVGQVFAHAGRIVGRPELAESLGRFGAALGSWVYAFDAWQDLGDDVRLGRFNGWVAASRGAVDAREVAAYLSRAVARASAALAELPLGGQGSVVAALLASLQCRSGAVAAAAVPSTQTDRRQAGDCDCPVGDLSCCDCSCCEAGGGAAAESSGCSGCGAPDCCCHVYCCWTSDARERRTVRRVRRADTRRGESVGVDLSGLVGATGEAVTDLLPEGRVALGGLEFDAVVDAGMVPRGSRVVVLAVEGGRLRVERSTG